MIDNAALIARLDGLPAVMRAALAGEIERLARALRKRAARLSAAHRVSLAIDSSNDTVTATLTARSTDTARPRRERPHGLRHPAAARTQRTTLDAAFDAMGPEIRAGLEMAVRREFAA